MKYYSVWQGTRPGGWVFRRFWCLPNDEYVIDPDLFVVNSTIGVWLDRNKLEKDPIFQRNHNDWGWEIREFTTVDALKERLNLHK